MNRKPMIAGSLALLALLFTGCGGSGSGGSTMSTAQAATAYSYVYEALADAGGALSVNRETPFSQLSKEQAARVQKAILNGAQGTPAADLIAPALSTISEASTKLPTYTFSCPSGGTIVVNGSWSETSSSVSESVVETINSCQADGVTMNGDPNISISATGTLSGSTVTESLTMSGGLTVGSSSCTTDLTINATVNTSTDHGSETYSGSFCGVNLSGSTSF
ncbi:MAG: hypothetical protein WB424_00995 [Terracidiphilus sp.]